MPVWAEIVGCVTIEKKPGSCPFPLDRSSTDQFGPRQKFKSHRSARLRSLYSHRVAEVDTQDSAKKYLNLEVPVLSLSWETLESVQGHQL